MGRLFCSHFPNLGCYLFRGAVAHPSTRWRPEVNWLYDWHHKMNHCQGIELYILFSVGCINCHFRRLYGRLSISFDFTKFNYSSCFQDKPNQLGPHHCKDHASTTSYLFSCSLCYFFFWSRLLDWSHHIDSALCTEYCVGAWPPICLFPQSPIRNFFIMWCVLGPC